MNEHDASMDSANPTFPERLLSGFRPVGPPPALREKTLTRALAVAEERSRHRLAVGIWRAAVAAGFLIAVGLNLSAERISEQIAAQLSTGQADWTARAEQAAELLDGNGWARQYLALALRFEPHRSSPFMPSAGWDVDGPSSRQ